MDVDLPCKCYTDEDLRHVAKAIVDLKVCTKQLAATKNLLDESTEIHETEWWQEPSFVIGGVAVSFSLGLLIGMFSK